MSTSQVKACLRCHSKKIKCSGYPDCSSCRHAGTRCEAYIRPRRHESSQLKEAYSRIRWLEDEVQRELGITCTSVPTGTPLTTRSRQGGHQQRPVQSGDNSALADSSVSTPQSVAYIPLDTVVANDASEASLLALNASGELRYLGASSGAFFASCAAALVRSSAHGSRPRTRAQAEGLRDAAACTIPQSAIPISLNGDEIELLLRSYEMWVHPLYPLLDLGTLRGLVARHRNNLSKDLSDVNAIPNSQRIEMTIVLVVIALGATNRANAIKQLRVERNDLVDRVIPTPTYSADSLRAASLEHFKSCLETLQADIQYVQMLLLFCIYSSYGPVGPSQWQLAGLAIRMAIEIGLHHDPKRWYGSEQRIEQRRRVFWTAYAIEVTLAYNLGRPASISHEHITTKLPNNVPDLQPGILHIKHRQIQGRIMSKMYQVSSNENVTWDQQQSLLAELQTELDHWRSSVSRIIGEDLVPQYPPCYWDRLYHSTTFVLHRKGPLCPRPSPESLNRCIRAAGAYIDTMILVLRSSNIPESWMLVQGVVSAGLTMLISARANFKQLDCTLLLADLASWSRKCSVCLAIMNERWHEDLLSKLETHLETLSDDTLKFISIGLATERVGSEGQAPSIIDAPNPEQTTRTSASSTHTIGPNSTSHSDLAVPNIQKESLSMEWEPLNVFGEFLDAEFMNTYWDTYGMENGVPTSYQNLDVEEQNTNFQEFP